MDYILLGANIRARRKALGITQEALAEACNITPVFISQIENAMRKPSLETVWAISLALGSSMDSLIRGADSQYPAEELAAILKGHTQMEVEFALSILRQILSCLQENRLTGPQA